MASNCCLCSFMSLNKSSTIHQGPLSAVVGGTALGGGDDSTIHAEQMARQEHGQAQGQTHFEGRISAFSLNGIWCGLALGIFPWFGQLRAVDEDTFVRPLTCGVPCIIPLLWPHFVWRGLCSREYRRTPGTNTFYWHDGWNYRKEDGETFISRFCLGTEPIKGCGCRVCCF